MVERYMRQSALAGQGLDGRRTVRRGEAGVALDERRFPAIVDLRGKAKDKAFMAAAEKLLGVALPTVPNSVVSAKGVGVAWMSPEEWWVIARSDQPDAERRLAAKLREGLAGLRAAVTEVGESRCCILVSGPRAGDLLAKGCPVDLHPKAFGGVGRSAQTLLAKATVFVHQTAEDETAGPSFEVYTTRSFADYLWSWLEDAAQEYGVAIHGA
jgi:sarcosine oxidase subunit gamma